MGVHTWFHRPIKDGEELNSWDKTIDYETGLQMTSVRKYHNLFRLESVPGNYEEITLRSYEETIQFVKENNPIWRFPDNWEEQLKGFWQDYPDGTIEFI